MTSLNAGNTQKSFYHVFMIYTDYFFGFRVFGPTGFNSKNCRIASWAFISLGQTFLTLPKPIQAKQVGSFHQFPIVYSNEPPIKRFHPILLAIDNLIWHC